MIKALISDFSRVLLFPLFPHSGSLNGLHKELSVQPNYRLLANFELNIELLKYYESLSKKLPCYIFTSENIQDSPEIEPFIKPVFSQIFSAMKMGLDKKDENAYKKLAEMVNLSTSEIVYVDDSEVNIEAAKKVGMNVILFKDNKSLKENLQDLI